MYYRETNSFRHYDSSSSFNTSAARSLAQNVEPFLHCRCKCYFDHFRLHTTLCHRLSPPTYAQCFSVCFFKQQDKTQASRRTDALNNKMVVFWCNTIFHLASEQLRVITSTDLNTG